MKGTGPYLPLLISLFIQLALDFYVYRGIRLVNDDLDGPSKTILFWTYWGISAGVIFLGIYNAYTIRESFNTGQRVAFHNYSFAILILLLIPKMLYASFLIIDDLVHFSRWFIGSLYSVPSSDNGISRLKFINQMGLLVASVPFMAIIYGVLKGRFDYTVMKTKLKFTNLPKSFDGFKVVQISDMHLGSFYDNHGPVQKAIDKINELEADLVLFTGDMVNNFGFETRGWEPVLSQIRAKYGKFSVLGNHDYGDYAESTKILGSIERANNFEEICSFHKKIGFDLLMDENRTILKDGEYFRVLGVQNWGAKGGLRKQYGDLFKALEGTDSEEFQILLSHDPSHWEGQIIENSKIDLTLSGHTHGMQFGIRIPGFEWSLVKYIYPQWAGLYSKGNRHIYVNRGFGYVGFPGRVGIPPEITLIELQSA